MLLLAISYGLHWGGFTVNVDRLIHDSWVRIHQREAPKDIVIVGIDSGSLEKFGRWPWPRDLQAAFYRKLAKLGVKATVIDILYVEPDNEPAADKDLAAAIAELPIAVLPVHTEGVGAYTEQAENLPIPQISSISTALGHIFLPIDPDGIVRRTSLKAGFKTAHWEVLSLATYNLLDGDLHGDDVPGERLKLNSGKNTTNWVEDHQALIPFYGPAKTFTNIGVDEIFDGTVDPALLKDKIVFVGATSTGLLDMLPTAVTSRDTLMPGVEIHANIYAALREGSLVKSVDQRLNFIVCGLVQLLILLLYSRLSPIWGLLGAGVGAFVPIIISFVLYRFSNVWYPPLVASVPLLISYFLWSWHRLDFLSQFMRSEADKLSDEFGHIDNTNNILLAQFFQSAATHLPLNAWCFTAGGEEYSGGAEESLEFQSTNLSTDIWAQQGDTFSRKYTTPGNLKIAFATDNHQFASDFGSYVDSLSRVRERQTPARLAGSIERMQLDTQRLSSQVERLRQLNVLSESIFEGSSAGHIVWSAAGEVVRANELAETSMQEIDVEKTNLHDFVAAIGRDPETQDKQRMQSLLLDAEPWQVNRIQDDSELVINFSAHGASLAERLVSASIVDVTEIRRSERSRAELIDFLSHDLRSPLISSLYMLTDDLHVSGAENDEKIERIESNINLSLTMMDDLLTIARADNLTSEQFSMVLFDSVIDNAVAQMLPQARIRNIAIDVQEHDEEIWVNADAALLERAVVNIVSNAVKYSPDDTRVTVSIRLNGEFILLEVQDQGIGIAPDMMDNLFKRFKRDAKISKQFKGIGLGLALVSRVVSQHGGRVWASSPGKGTLISAEIPYSYVGEYVEEAG